jgi:hypothetical protein
MSDDFSNPATNPPSGLDRATVIGDFPGTPTPDNAIAQRIATLYTDEKTFLEEDPNSPNIELGEQGTIRHTFWCDWDITALGFLTGGTLQRGSYFKDSYGNHSRVLNSSIDHFKGEIAKVVVTCESAAFGLPPDEFSIEPVELNPDAVKHPRYNLGQYIANEDDDDDGDYDFLNDQQKGVIRYVTQAPSLYAARDSLQGIFNSSQTSFAGGPIRWTTNEQKMAWEIVTKFYRGEDTFYLPAFVVTYTTFYAYPQSDVFTINPGGYIEDPTTVVFGASVPYDFWSIDGTDDNTPLNNLLQCVQGGGAGSLWDSGVTYLRKADKVSFERNFWKITQTWVGAPTGPKTGNGNYIFWDPDWYGATATELQPLPTTPS